MKIFYIIVALLILLLMITIHEFGHYIAGRILKFKIDEFSIGFGPALFSKKKKNGELFSIRLLPLGGYCAFAGESEEENILAPEKLKKNKSEAVFGEAESNTENTAGSVGKAGTTDSVGTGNLINSAEKENTAGSVGKTDITDPVGTGNLINSAGSEEANVIQASDLKAEEKKAEGNGELKKFNEQPPWKRIIVLMAGGVFNLLSGILFSLIFIAVAGGSTPHISKVYDGVNSAAVCALREGDVIKRVNGQKIDFYHTLEKALDGVKEGDRIEMVVIRDGEELEVSTTIRTYDPYEGEELPEDSKYPIGMGVGLYYDRASFGEAVMYCVPYTGQLAWQVLKTFGLLIIGKVPLAGVSGTIGAVDQIADYGMQSYAYLLILMPLIAVNLGLFNLFPIPALDGAKVVFTVVEWIRGKPVNQKVEGMIHMVGLIVLLGLVFVLDMIYLIMKYLL